ncbi:MAG: hypothetical protein CMM01_08245 [Rhodopirellula sp.]|nr:hypothetical protein [Rhodopirellula sp.]
MPGKPIDFERLTRSSILFGFLETELRIPLLGLATIDRDFEVDGERTFPFPRSLFVEAVFVKVENEEV